MSVSGWGTTLGTASINSSGAFSLPFTVTTAPQVSWTSPVGNSGTSYVSSGQVMLAASATSPIGVARVTFIWIYRDLPSSWRLKGTNWFATQIGSGGVPGSGSDNCGPASITMAILYYGGSATVPAAATY